MSAVSMRDPLVDLTRKSTGDMGAHVLANDRYLGTDINTRTVDFAIARLRRKVEVDHHHPQFIRTAHGDGYCLTGVSDERSAE